MATLHQRNRIVVFRLTQEEYNSLRSACEAAGSRNLSDYTRTELLSLIHSEGSSSMLDLKLSEIDRKLSAMQGMLQKVLPPEKTPPEKTMVKTNNGSAR